MSNDYLKMVALAKELYNRVLEQDMVMLYSKEGYSIIYKDENPNLKTLSVNQIIDNRAALKELFNWGVDDLIDEEIDNATR